MVGGIGTMTMAQSNYAALAGTRALYYAEYRFGEVFARAKRAPLPLMETVRTIPGVRVAEALEELPATSPQREHRLYQASFLIRDYGFTLEEMPFNQEGNLPSTQDPKLAWANEHMAGTPIEINLANRHELMRIPGIGPKGANTILSARRQNQFHTVDDLRRIGINPTKALPYILLAGRKPIHQISMF